MSQQNKKMQLLGNAPIPQALLAMGIPTMIGMLVNALYNLVDAYFVGGLGESQMDYHQRARRTDAEPMNLRGNLQFIGSFFIQNRLDKPTE